MGQVLAVTATPVIVYLVVSHATGAGQLLQAAGSAYSGSVRVLQGR